MNRLTLFTTFFAFTVICGVTAVGQEAKTTPEEPKTKLETFQAKTGTVIIKGFTEAGKITGQYGGSIEVNSREFKDATTGLTVHGITIQVKDSGRLERSDISFIDYDEIDSLLKGLDYVSKIDSTVTRLAKFEASYRTKGDFSITTFSRTEGGIGAAVSSGRIGPIRVFLSLDNLQQLRQIIVDAKSKLDAVRQSR